MEYFACKDPRSYSLYFDLNIWFRARKVIGTLQKRAPDMLTPGSESTVQGWQKSLNFVSQTFDAIKKSQVKRLYSRYNCVFRVLV